MLQACDLSKQSKDKTDALIEIPTDFIELVQKST